MKIYRAWLGSLHGVEYTIGYFNSREKAEQSISEFHNAGSSPDKGVEEITIK